MSPEPDDHPTLAHFRQFAEDQLTGDAYDRFASHRTEHPNCARCRVMLARVNDPRPDPVFPGFELLNCGVPIAAGGMGEVFLARELGIGRTVAVKRVHRKFDRVQTEDRARYLSDFVDRFVKEGQLLGRIRHAGVPTVFRLGWADPAGECDPYFAMEYIPDETLRTQLDVAWEDRAELTPDQVNTFLVSFGRVCEAVEYAHQRGTVHLDLKPENITVQKFGAVKVLDWGLSVELAAPTPGMTRLGNGEQDELPEHFGGTADYMPPEQATNRRDEVGCPADIFALGGILCHILTSQPTYTGRRALDRARRGDLADARTRLEARRTQHSELVALALACLAPEPDRRPKIDHVTRTVREILLAPVEKARRAAVEALAVETQLRAAVEGRAAVETQLRIAVEGKAQADRRASKFKLVALAMLSLLLIGVAGVFLVDSIHAAHEGYLAQLDAAFSKVPKYPTEDTAGGEPHPEQREDTARALATAERVVEAVHAQTRAGPQKWTWGFSAPADVRKRLEKLAEDVTAVRAEVAATKLRADTARVFCDAADRARAEHAFHGGTDPVARYGRLGDAGADRARNLLGVFTLIGYDPHATDPPDKKKFPPAYHRAAVVVLDHAFLFDPTPEAKKYLRLADGLDDDDERVKVRECLRAGGTAARRFWGELQKQNRAGEWLAEADPEAVLLLAAALTLEGDPDAAAEVCKRHLGRKSRQPQPGKPDPGKFGDFWVLLTLGVYLTRRGEDAGDLFDRATKVLNLGPKPAIDSAAPAPCRAALRDAVDARRRYAGFLRAATGMPSEQTVSELRAAVETDKADGRLRELLVQALARCGKRAEAVAAAKAWRDHDQTDRTALAYERYLSSPIAPGCGYHAPALADFLAFCDGHRSDAVDRLRVGAILVGGGWLDHPPPVLGTDFLRPPRAE